VTALIGLLCSDGVVIGADSSATMTAGNMRTIEQRVKKVFIVVERMIIAGTGSVGMCQRFTNAVQRAFEEKKFSSLKFATDYAKNLSATGKIDFQHTGCGDGKFGALVAFPHDNNAQLCELAGTDFQPELKTPDMWFVSMGSGQPITDPFLGLMKRVFYKNSVPTLKEGIFLTTWALTHVIELNPGGVNGPPQIAVLPNGLNEKARIIGDEELAEHQNSVEGAEAHMALYREILQSGNAPKQEAPPAEAPKA